MSWQNNDKIKKISDRRNDKERQYTIEKKKECRMSLLIYLRLTENHWMSHANHEHVMHLYGVFIHITVLFRIQECCVNEKQNKVAVEWLAALVSYIGGKGFEFTSGEGLSWFSSCFPVPYRQMLGP